nr:hypothetical protein GCM10020092_000810 [Actinoplanes digitatis]
MVGAVLWCDGVILLGYLLAQQIYDAIGDKIDHYILPVVALIVLISVLPILIEIIRERRAKKNAVHEAGPATAIGVVAAATVVGMAEAITDHEPGHHGHHEAEPPRPPRGRSPPGRSPPGGATRIRPLPVRSLRRRHPGATALGLAETTTGTPRGPAPGRAGTRGVLRQTVTGVCEARRSRNSSGTSRRSPRRPMVSAL